MGNSAALLTSPQIGSTGGLSSIKKMSSAGNGFDDFGDLQEILHQKMYFASNFIFWIEIGWVIGYLARRGER